MNKIESLYRVRRRLLVSAFVCSCFLFLVLCFPWPYRSPAFAHAFPWRHFKNPVVFIFEMAGILAALLLLFLLTRFVLLRAVALKEPALRQAVDDERIKMGWLSAYRIALYVMAGIHLAYLSPVSEGFFYNIGFPHAAWVSSSLGLMVLFGAAFFFTRELKNGQA
jgi:hypothetical protein